MQYRPFSKLDDFTQIALDERNYLIEDYNNFKQELTNIAKELGYDNPYDYPPIAKHLDEQTKELNESLALIDSFIAKRNNKKLKEN